MLKKIDDLKEPPIVGELYLVPCMVLDRPNMIPDWEVDLTGELVNNTPKDLLLYPVINHLHNDKENGQKEPHYHRDFRFKPIFVHQYLDYGVTSIRLYPHIETMYKEKSIEYFAMSCETVVQRNPTPVTMIRESKLKHKCIHKGKCPHRGYDLSQVVPVDGKITCPLHGLRFHADTKQIVEEPMFVYLSDRITKLEHDIEQHDGWETGDRERIVRLQKTLSEMESELQRLYPESYAERVKAKNKVLA